MNARLSGKRIPGKSWFYLFTRSLALILFVLLRFSRTPLFHPIRIWDNLFLIVTSSLLIFLELRQFYRFRIGWQRLGQLLYLVVLGYVVINAGGKEIRFAKTKQAVITSTSPKLKAIGAHFIVGFSNLDEVKALAQKGAIGGIYITSRNIKGKSTQDVSQEISSLQKVRQEAGLPLLFIATDQEGGLVSRLSPLIPFQPPLSSLVSSNLTIEEGKVSTYATTQASALRNLGINLDFSPVVDLSHPGDPQAGGYTMLKPRTIGSEPSLVATVAATYSQILIQNQVLATLKHFPGLGSVGQDTHTQNALLTLPLSELENRDWIPFKTVSTISGVTIMVSHAQMAAVDPKTPSSFSKPVIDGILRQNWKFEGLLITDDFSMAPVFTYPGSVGKASQMALNSGMDLILISYDPDLYYEAMAILLQDNRIDNKKLEISKKRIEEAQKLIITR